MLDKLFSFFNLKKNDAPVTNTGVMNIAKENKTRRIKEVFTNIPRFETPRLILRRIREIDYIDMHEYSADTEVTKYLTWRPHSTMSETKNYTNELQRRYDTGKFFDWGIVHKEDGKFIGTCGFTSINVNNNSCEIGYVLAKKYWGRGLIPEALELIMDFAFTYFKFDRIDGRFLEGNVNSRKVMLKMGMVLDKIDYNLFHIKGEYKTVHTYYITREMFEARKYARK